MRLVRSVVLCKCCKISDSRYQYLANSSCSWICLNCGLPNFSTSLFDSFRTPTEDSFHLLSFIGDDELRMDKSTIDASFSLGTPLHTSSPSQRYNICCSKLRILTVNCNSLQSKSKQNQLIDLIETHNPDIICGQESKLDESMKTNEIFPPTFQDQVFRKDFKAGERGVFIAIKNDILWLLRLMIWIQVPTRCGEKSK